MTVYYLECAKTKTICINLDAQNWGTAKGFKVVIDRTSLFCRRESAVKDLINRHIELSEDKKYLQKEDFLQEKLMVPKEWVHYAKVLCQIKLISSGVIVVTVIKVLTLKSMAF